MLIRKEWVPTVILLVIICVACYDASGEATTEDKTPAKAENSAPAASTPEATTAEAAKKEAAAAEKEAEAAKAKGRLSSYFVTCYCFDPRFSQLSASISHPRKVAEPLPRAEDGRVSKFLFMYLLARSRKIFSRVDWLVWVRFPHLQIEKLSLIRTADSVFHPHLCIFFSARALVARPRRGKSSSVQPAKT